MKKVKIILLLIALISISNLQAQNPTWTLPPNQYKPQGTAYTPLPMQTASNVSGYHGIAATNLHAGYTDPDGSLLFFTVDGSVYDKNGYEVGLMKNGSGYTKKGYNERLILPMGNDCRRFAIIYSANPDQNENYNEIQLGERSLYMSIYDLDEPNTWEANAEGELFDFGNSTTLLDISKRDGQLYGTPQIPIFGYTNPSGLASYTTDYQIAASGLIDNCFYFVFVFDGQRVLRYKLTSDDLEYDGVVAGPFGAVSNTLRTEMELIKLPNENYRIAIPWTDYESPGPSGQAISIFDVNPTTGVLISGTLQEVPLFNDGNPYLSLSAEPYGVEFSQNGRYLYITHATNLNLPNVLDVWDVNTSSFLTIPALTGISNFQKSYIERYGNALYLASDDMIARINNSNDPANIDDNFDPNFRIITSGYGNDAGTGYAPLFRYLLPEQLDMAYPSLESFSCECCSRWGGDAQSFQTGLTQTWSPGIDNNPFTETNTVRITEELRIKAGANITINNMIFKFDPDAKVVIERGNGILNGGRLTLNGTTFTADQTCRDESGFSSCGIPDGSDDCERDFWQGVIVDGITGYPQSHTGTTRQGRFTVQNNSMVEFARIGVLAGSLTDQTRGGGVVVIKNSDFKDNIKGAHFAPYVRLSGNTELYTLSNIERSHFYTTADFLTLSPAVPNNHVHVNELSGLYLYANIYENQAPSSFTGNSRGTGVYVSNSRVRDRWLCSNGTYGCSGGTIYRSQYNDLTVGFDGVSSGQNRTVYVHHAIFSNNTTGVRLSGYSNPEVLDNDFEVALHRGVGLSMTACTGYQVENNNFQSVTLAGSRGSGIIVRDSGEEYNEIYRNFFEDLSTGISAGGENAAGPSTPQGLLFKCNQFKYPIFSSDIRVVSGTVSDEQGHCNPVAGIPAGNLFSHSSTGISGHYDFRVYTNPPSPLEIDYRHYSTGAGSAPLVYTPTLVQLENCGISRPKGACPVIHTSLQSGDIIKSNEEEVALDYETVTNQMATLTSSISDAEAYLDGGNTWAILEHIENNDDADLIETLVAEAGESVSSTVLKSLTKSDNLEYQTLATSSLAGLSLSGTELTETGSIDVNIISLNSEEIENEWKYNREVLSTLWRDVTAQVQSDTIGTLSYEELDLLASTYEPTNSARFFALRALEQGMPTPEWIGNADNPEITDFSLIGLPASDSTGLPLELPEHYQNDFFKDFGNVVALNELYIAEGKGYDPYSEEIEEVEGADPKSNMQGGDVDAQADMIVTQPNPFSDFIQFTLTENVESYESMRIEMYDMLGRRLHSEVFGGDQKVVRIEGSKLPTGIITYVVFIDGAPVQNGKVIRVK